MRICHRIFSTKAVAVDANSICLVASKLSFSKQKQRGPRASSPARQQMQPAKKALSLWYVITLRLGPAAQPKNLFFFFYFLLRLYRQWQSPNRLHNYVVQVQSARKSNCSGCLELPETVWKLRAELSEAPKGLTGLHACAPAKHRKTVCLLFHFACAADSMRIARAFSHFFNLSIDNCINPTC